ncbi:hypothetical protein [Pseudonocardia xishanensis]|uniref:hypothetical protein n=1 Tax=Pseudonocardia xishanensis TaxID=630995 RepID=UPI0031EE8400
MAFDAHALLVLIASPGDTVEERDAAERALHGWNADRAQREQVVLLPRRWETHAVPRLGGRAQSIINEQLVDESDIVIALFDSRLGMATGEAVSGTAEEIQRAHEAGKPVHVWFSDEPIPRNADLTQVAALREFKETVEPLGLLGTYASPDDLVFKVRQAIESDLAILELGPITRRKPTTGAVLRARYDYERESYIDNRGKTKYRTRRERIVVQNIGTATASEVELSAAPLGEGDAPSTLADETPTIIPQADFSWRIFPSAGDSRSIKLTMSWHEDGRERSETQDLSLS